MRPLLELKGVSKFFGGLAALVDVSFTVNEGEVVGLIGPNGAGKTTLFNVINGFYKPSKGEVYFDGKRISGLRPHRICRLGVARTFQVVKPLQRLTVIDNVMASAFLRSPSRQEALERAEKILHFVGLYEDRETVSKNLPLGKRKKLEIARALATEPKLLLLDESFAGLNPKEQAEMIETIKKINREGVTILIIEHHMRVIMSISNRVVVLNYGEKIAEGSPQEVASSPEVIKAYLGETAVA